MNRVIGRISDRNSVVKSLSLLAQDGRNHVYAAYGNLLPLSRVQ
jgi:hypothetical protein